MPSQELVKTLDYILNRCNEADIEAVAAAVVRRRRDIAMYGAMPVAPDPRRMAEELTSQLNIGGNIENLKTSIRDYAIRIIRQQAPELTDAQINELTRSWIPDRSGRKKTGKSNRGQSITADTDLPHDLLLSMIDQFVSFSMGRMEEEDDRALRREIGAWPARYWDAFPQVIRLLITDFLKGEIEEDEFNSKLNLAL